MEIVLEILTEIDVLLLSAFHSLAEVCGGFFTPFSKVLTFVGEKGVVFLLMALFLFLFPKTRKLGICLFGAIACCFLVSNLMLKEWIARPRPYLATDELLTWWRAAGSAAESGFSCPSGHVGAATAGVSAIWFFRKRGGKYEKRLRLLFLWPVLMAFARCYLMAHYPSDCVLGFLVGWLSAFAAWYVTEVIYILLENHSTAKLPAFVLRSNLYLMAKSKIRAAGTKKSESAPK